MKKASNLCSWCGFVKRCFSSVQKTAAASTRVGVCLSQYLRQSAAGSGKIMLLQYLIISCLPAAVVAVVRGGGGADNGDICLEAKPAAG